jgi:hypothetical protein
VTRKLVALVFHLPGLYLVYGYKPERRLIGWNLLSLFLTLLLIAAGYLLGGIRTAVVFFLVGHSAWGAFLAASVGTNLRSN